MGPCSGGTGRHAVSAGTSRHSKCREGERCTGPGCNIMTGKTQSSNRIYLDKRKG